MQIITPTSTPAVGSVYRCAMPVRWGDLDALNHVNNTVYFRFFEEARVQLFSQVGIMPPSRKAGVVAHVACDFLKPLMYPAMAVVTQVLVRVGRSSIEMETLLEREDEPGVLYAKGSYVIVGTDAETGKSLPWSEQELALLAELMSA
ncbi:acyl-CoA thioesterase [Pollutimonas harenae]|uniref:Acyl-CoA thioesterase n=1 Tax=Pollutimonas harenae TaxID=657015 RepID=A0A853GZN9_9BURK|nr:thioesterase family protein [Pollutimonas harenae]NYT85562.1 acyl-CoA thioesterase [Pollutimonas harenae]TEA70645.1 acyl-CoA thioesterase [Pollutimonas harenae]